MLTLKTHEYKRQRGGSVLTRVTPYVRLKAVPEGQEDGPPVFIQQGVYYWEDGTKIDKDELPKWVAAEVAKLSDKAKKDVGLIK